MALVFEVLMVKWFELIQFEMETTSLCRYLASRGEWMGLKSSMSSAYR